MVQVGPVIQNHKTETWGVTFLSQQSDKKPVANCCSILVLPSYGIQPGDKLSVYFSGSESKFTLSNLWISIQVFRMRTPACFDQAGSGGCLVGPPVGNVNGTIG